MQNNFHFDIGDIEEILPNGELEAEGDFYAKEGLMSMFDGLGRVGQLYVFDDTQLTIDIPPSAVTRVEVYNIYYEFGENTFSRHFCSPVPKLF